MVKSKPPVALIAGPTASGKSALGLALAHASGGAVINADSAQLYRDLPILSAAPSAAERGAADHRLYGVRDGADPCSAADWASLARVEIDALHAERRLPILVGGTGLYFRTLLDGIAPVPPIDPAIRAEVRAASVAENVAALAALDPCSAARLNPGDTSRVARALEVVRSTKRTLGDWQIDRAGGIKERVVLRPLILLPPRDWLVERARQQRFDLGNCAVPDHRFEAAVAALDQPIA
ncbi:MAG: hypothetical protein LC656_04760, partial [Sphingomonadales bacterium]|nr:hypothetical protein [Sphingomonadales bacterium]